jgi:hypothetical protein
MSDISETDALDLVLSFFSRVESKISFLFGLNTALLGISYVNIALDQVTKWYVAIPLVCFLGLIAVSFVHLYFASFPQLKGGSGSIFFFGEIAKRTEANYIREYEGKTQAEKRADLLGQVWRNSEILTQKFARLRSAFVLTLSSLPFLTLEVLAATSATGKLFKV